MGSGVAQYIRIKEREKEIVSPGTVGQPSMMPPRRVDAFPTRSTGELVRHLRV